MNKTIPETRDFLRSFLPLVKDTRDRDIVIAPPFTALSAAAEALKGSGVKLSAQDVFWEEKGAYTGEVSATMILDSGCSHVIIGHSERRQYFFEDDVIVNRKVKAARTAGLDVIMCVGESLEEREASRTFDVIKRQVEAGLAEVGPENLVVAYEPIWAIGTGRTATAEQAQEVHAFIRKVLGTLYGKRAEPLRIIYGGSVTTENVDGLMACEDVSGALVGGASLKAESFARIANFK